MADSDNDLILPPEDPATPIPNLSIDPLPADLTEEPEPKEPTVTQPNEQQKKKPATQADPHPETDTDTPHPEQDGGGDGTAGKGWWAWLNVNVKRVRTLAALLIAAFAVLLFVSEAKLLGAGVLLIGASILWNSRASSQVGELPADVKLVVATLLIIGSFLWKAEAPKPDQPALPTEVQAPVNTDEIVNKLWARMTAGKDATAKDATATKDASTKDNTPTKVTPPAGPPTLSEELAASVVRKDARTVLFQKPAPEGSKWALYLGGVKTALIEKGAAGVTEEGEGLVYNQATDLPATARYYLVSSADGKASQSRLVPAKK